MSYWNAYVAVTQMHGHGSFTDERLGSDIQVPAEEDEVTSKLPALREYQFSLEPPAPPAGSFDAKAAQRGKGVFRRAGCGECHAGPRLTSERLFEPEETGMDGAYAARSATKRYRATPLRGLWQHPPYFHDGSAETLADVVDHYDSFFDLDLDEDEKRDLEAWLMSL